MKTSATRIYIVMQGDTVRLVKALSQAQAMRRVARETMTVRPAHSLEVMDYMMQGVKVLDAKGGTGAMEQGILGEGAA
ncbi:MAG: hypothetical protein AB1717_05985 [Pseudomonadota bacterium]